jgi:putative iron-dependent peroxidase
MNYQNAILTEPSSVARFVALGLKHTADAREALRRLSAWSLPQNSVIGLGQPLVLSAKAKIPALRSFPSLTGPGVNYPSTQGSLWACFSGNDSGHTLMAARDFLQAMGPDFYIEEDVHSFKYAEGRDLTGYEDGTENPKADQAVEAAFVRGEGPGMDGSSFVAVQRWLHDLAEMEKMTAEQRDHVIGRNHRTNEELPHAPESSHVKRAARESYDPPAFMLRRSMPWGTIQEHGLYFVAYGSSLDPFEKVLRRMAGLEDGVPDALAQFTRPLSGGYYWCPPVKQGRLDLRVLGVE